MRKLTAGWTRGVQEMFRPWLPELGLKAAVAASDGVSLPGPERFSSPMLPRTSSSTVFGD